MHQAAKILRCKKFWIVWIFPIILSLNHSIQQAKVRKQEKKIGDLNHQQQNVKLDSGYSTHGAHIFPYFIYLFFPNPLPINKPDIRSIPPQSTIKLHSYTLRSPTKILVYIKHALLSESSQHHAWCIIIKPTLEKLINQSTANQSIFLTETAKRTKIYPPNTLFHPSNAKKLLKKNQIHTIHPKFSIT